MSDWRSIETAPRDGTPILVARHMREFGWIRGWAQWQSLEFAGYDGGWVSYGMFEPFGNLGLAEPTHWQPIPEPPK